MSAADVRRARRLYQGFREAPPQRATLVRRRLSRALAQIGLCEFVGYATTHGGELKLYIHEFAPGSRPGLYASGRRGELMIVGGRFTVTDRGITDLNAQGRPVDARPRYKVTLRKPRR